jgi:hypothetical protein
MTLFENLYVAATNGFDGAARRYAAQGIEATMGRKLA